MVCVCVSFCFFLFLPFCLSLSLFSNFSLLIPLHLLHTRALALVPSASLSPPSIAPSISLALRESTVCGGRETREREKRVVKLARRAFSLSLSLSLLSCLSLYLAHTHDHTHTHTHTHARRLNSPNSQYGETAKKRAQERRARSSDALLVGMCVCVCVCVCVCDGV